MKDYGYGNSKGGKSMKAPWKGGSHKIGNVGANAKAVSPVSFKSSYGSRSDKGVPK